MVRITQTLLSNQSYFNLQKNMQRVVDVQEILSTGKIISSPTDDPVGFPIALNLRTQIQQGQSYQRNVDSTRGTLELTESTMDSLTETLQTIREIAVQGANSLDSNARFSLSEQVKELYGHIFDLANTDYKGQNLFGGSATKGQAFSVQGDAIIYNGDDFQRDVLISKQATVTTNLNGLETFLHTPNQITGSIRIADTSAPLSEQIRLVNPDFPNLPPISSKPQDSLSDPSPNPNNYPTDIPNKYATFQVYGTEIRVDLTADSLEDVVNRINASVDGVTASISDLNQLVITSQRTDALELQDGDNPIGFEPDAPFGVNVLSALGMHRQVDATRPLTFGYPSTDPLSDPTLVPAPARSAVKVENRSFLFASSNTGPDDNPSVPFGDNLALTNIDDEGNDAYLVNGNPEFLTELEALRITIDEEVIDIDLRSLTQGTDFDAVPGNEDDIPGSTLEDLLELVNNHPQLKGKATAYINADGTGLAISAVRDTDVFKVEDVRRLFGRDITKDVVIDPITGDETYSDFGTIDMDTKLDDLPGALVDPALDGSAGIRRDTTIPSVGNPDLNRGLIAISNDGENEGIDLREAETIGDVIRAINASKVGVEARINETGTGIDIVSIKPGDGELSVVDMFQGTTARDLGLFQTSTPTRIQSVGGLTATDAIAVAVPAASSGSFEIEVRDAAGAVLDTYTIDVDTSVPNGDTIESLTAKIDEADGKSGPGSGAISAFMSGGVLNIASNYDGHTLFIDSAQDTTGVDAVTRITDLLEINEYTYTLEANTPAMVPYESKQNTASVLGINQEGTVNETEEKNIFRTVKNLERALRNDDTEGITQALEDLDIDLDAILNKRTQIGARMNRLDASSVNLQNSEDFMREELSTIEDADLAEAINDLTLTQNAYNAALAATSRVIQQTLMDFL